MGPFFCGSSYSGILLNTGDLLWQAIDNISVYPLRFELQALRVYTLMWPISFHIDPSIHYLFRLPGSSAAVRVPEFSRLIDAALRASLGRSGAAKSSVSLSSSALMCNAKIQPLSRLTLCELRTCSVLEQSRRCG